MSETSNVMPLSTSLRQELQEIADQATAYFNRVASQVINECKYGSELWSLASTEDKQLVEGLSSRIRQTVSAISYAARLSLLVVQADYAALRFAMKSMTAALRFHFVSDIKDGEEWSLTYFPSFDSKSNPVVSQAISGFMDNYSKVVGYVGLLEPRGDSPNDLPQTSSSPSLEPPTPPESKAMPVARFPHIPDLKWDEVSMEFVSNDSIRIRAHEVRKIYTVAETGFKDGRKGDRPDSLWGVLRDGFGKHGGEISWNTSLDSKTKDNLKEYVPR